MQILNRMCV